jgi:hypothetical protein
MINPSGEPALFLITDMFFALKFGSKSSALFIKPKFRNRVFVIAPTLGPSEIKVNYSPRRDFLQINQLARFPNFRNLINVKGVGFIDTILGRFSLGGQIDFAFDLINGKD